MRRRNRTRPVPGLHLLEVSGLTAALWSCTRKQGLLRAHPLAGHPGRRPAAQLSARGGDQRRSRMRPKLGPAEPVTHKLAADRNLCASGGAPAARLRPDGPAQRLPCPYHSTAAASPTRRAHSVSAAAGVRGCVRDEAQAMSSTMTAIDAPSAAQRTRCAGETLR